MSHVAQQQISLVDGFFQLVAAGAVEIYNEFSLQHEFGIYLRAHLPTDCRVQFERPVDYFFFPPKRSYVKKEIDISVFSDRTKPKLAFELKFPRNGQYPEQMFKACEDIGFLEQLVADGFESGCFIMTADHPSFWSGAQAGGVYDYFRHSRALTGLVQKPTGKRDSSVTIVGSYPLAWKSAGNLNRYLSVSIIHT